MCCDDDAPTPEAQPICVHLPTIVGIGETEVLERLVLSVPALNAAVAPLLPTVGSRTILSEVVPLSQGITVTDREVFNGKILLNGTLHKDLLLKYRPIMFTPPPGLVVGASTCMVCPAALVDLSVDCPFGACITVPGACPGDECFIELACVDAIKDLLIDVTGTGTPDFFEERVCIKLQVKAIRSRAVTLRT